MAKVLITGTAGFCMQNVVRRAINDKMPHSFASIDRINNDSNVIYYNKNHAFHIADVRDAHIIDKIFQFETPDIVIHGADESNVEDTSAIISSNILGTQIIIDNCHKYNVKKIIYVSSDKVYGQLDSETDKPFVEWISTNPRSLYGASKVSAELLVKTSGVS
jgi:dTDP-D-glucose 4,6-dehydratase